MPLRWKVYFAACAVPILAFALPAYGIWTLHTAETVADWTTLAAGWAGYWLLLWQLPVWHFVGTRFRLLCPALFAVGALVAVPPLLDAPAGWAALAESPGTIAWRAANLGLYVTVTLLFVRGGTPPSEPVDLEFPFAAGRYWVVQGGSSIFGNRHVSLLGDETSDARGEAFGVDLVELNSWGARAAGLLPRDLEKYVMFGRTVCAPMEGRVVATEDTMPDHPPPEHDAENPPGNCVWLSDGDVVVLLAHLRRGSVRVEPGDRVEAGDPVAAVGNSGRTTEPHLHIHAQRPADEGPRHSGDPLPLAFDGVFPEQASIFDA